MFWRPSDTPEDVLMHYAKGSTAKKHKYIRKEGDRYIYPDDVKKSSSKKKKPKTYDEMIEDAENETSAAKKDAINAYSDYKKHKDASKNASSKEESRLESGLAAGAKRRSDSKESEMRDAIQNKNSASNSKKKLKRKQYYIEELRKYDPYGLIYPRKLGHYRKHKGKSGNF